MWVGGGGASPFVRIRPPRPLFQRFSFGWTKAPRKQPLALARACRAETGVSGCRITYFLNDSCYRHRLAQVGAAGSAGLRRGPRCPELPGLVFLLALVGRK